MAKEATLLSDLQELGYQPIENRAIVLRFEPKNLSGEVYDFFSVNNYYVLQLCKKQIVLVPVKYRPYAIISTFKTQKSDILEIEYADVKNVDLTEKGINYTLSIELQNQTMNFKLQQKELSALRSSGTIGSDTGFWGSKTKNWHLDNFDQTLKDLLAVGDAN